MICNELDDVNIKSFRDVPSGSDCVIVTSIKPSSKEVSQLKSKLKRFASVIVTHNDFANFSEQRNIALSLSKKDWILVIDTDEVFIDSSNLLSKITTAETPQEIGGYTCQQTGLSRAIGLQDSTYYVVETVRIFRRSEQIYWEGYAHEQIANSIRKKGLECDIKLPIIFSHTGYMTSEILLSKKAHRNCSLIIKWLASENRNKEMDTYYHEILQRDFVAIETII
jgi:glycosyltransferase involved in cell wall biosynthesis